MGTVSDSIRFAGADYWMGLWFDGAQDNSHLENRVGGLLGSHIRCDNNSDPIISHCRITGDDRAIYGNILIGPGCTPSIFDCDNTNYEDACGAGNCASGAGLTRDQCTICNNYTRAAAGGIYCSSGSHTQTNCMISGNTSYNEYAPLRGGGGVCFYYANAHISYCTLCDNYAEHGGGAIALNGTASLTMDHCTVDGNETWSGAGSAILLEDSPTADIANSSISNNAGDYGISNQGTLALSTMIYGTMNCVP